MRPCFPDGSKCGAFSFGVCRPEELNAWMVEGLGGTMTLAGSAPLQGSPSAVVVPAAEPTFHLGPVVGQFVNRPEEAAWRVTCFAGKTTGARCRQDLAATS